MNPVEVHRTVTALLFVSAHSYSTFPDLLVPTVIEARIGISFYIGKELDYTYNPSSQIPSRSHQRGIRSRT
jgi:hypothetical protein